MSGGRVVFLDVGASTVVSDSPTIPNDGTTSATITVTVRNTDGNPFPNRAVTLAFVSGTGTLTQPVGTTNQQGVITGSVVSTTDNAMVIKATVLGVDITQTASVDASGGFRANEPVGYTQITSQPFVTSDADGWDVGSAPNKAIVDASLRTDATDAPVSSPSVLRAAYPAGYAGGSAPWVDTRDTGLSDEIYYAMALKLSANFEGHSSSTNKINFVWINGTPTTFLSAEGSGSNDLELQLRLQNDPDPRARLVPNVGPSGVLARGVWHNIEVQMICNATGVADGVARVWLNGTLITEYTDVEYVATNQNWGDFYLQPVWGGTGGTVTSDMYIDFDHVYVSGP
jgi:hypothetical protein